MSGPEARVNVSGVFATPIVQADLPDAARINAALRPAILARMKSHPSIEHSNVGGWQSSWDFAEWSGEAGKHLLGAAMSLATQLTGDRSGQPAKVDWKQNSWANVNQAGHGNEFHTHPGSFWSGTYYVDDGGIGADANLGGEFEFQDPRGVGPAMYAPQLAFRVPGGQSVGASETVRPRTGMMLLFPAWLSHQVRPYRGQGTRISVAFNLSVYG
ncbi:MAG: TIGR02466 family protein [Alphaproteobacteria bacterium]